MPQARLQSDTGHCQSKYHIFTKRYHNMLKHGCNLALDIVTLSIKSLLSDTTTCSSSVAICHWTFSFQCKKISNGHFKYHIFTKRCLKLGCDLALDIVTSSITSLLSPFKYHIFTNRCLKLSCDLALNIFTSGTSLPSDASSLAAIWH